MDNGAQSKNSKKMEDTMSVNSPDTVRDWFVVWANGLTEYRVRGLLDSLYTLLCLSADPGKDILVREAIGVAKQAYFKLFGTGYVCSFCAIRVA